MYSVTIFKSSGPIKWRHSRNIINHNFRLGPTIENKSFIIKNALLLAKPSIQLSKSIVSLSNRNISVTSRDNSVKEALPRKILSIQDQKSGVSLRIVTKFYGSMSQKGLFKWSVKTDFLDSLFFSDLSFLILLCETPLFDISENPLYIMNIVIISN
jgi:hypothetical protein